MIKDIYYTDSKTLSFIMSDESIVKVEFSIIEDDGKRLFRRDIISDSGRWFDILDFDAFNEGLTISDYMDFTCDNPIDIFETMEE